MTCNHDSGCDRKVLAKGLCQKHYQQQWRAALPQPPECKVEMCHKEAKARDWCDEHYYRWRRYGDPEGRPVKVKDQLCSMGDGRHAASRWIEEGVERGVLCPLHERRWRKYGDPAEPPRQAARGKGRYTSDEGYILVGEFNADGTLKTTTGKTGRTRTLMRGEHCVLMEELLGRPLTKQENVHHRNGVKTDNSTNGPLVNYRSGNLELWSTKQPKGQRVEDKIEFALEILREYAPEHLCQKSGT